MEEEGIRADARKRCRSPTSSHSSTSSKRELRDDLDVLLAKKDYAAAYDVYVELCQHEMDPVFLEELWFKRAETLIRLNEYDRAFSELETCISFKATGKALCLKGSLLFNLKRSEEALSCLTEAVLLDPENETYRNRLQVAKLAALKSSQGELYTTGLDRANVLLHSRSYPLERGLPGRADLWDGAAIKTMAVGKTHGVAVSYADKLLIWGQGQSAENRPEILRMRQSLKVVQVAVGKLFSLALTDAGNILSWGHNEHGQLGMGHVSHKILRPESVSILGEKPRFTEISAGWHHAGAVTDSGAVYVWGEGANGRLGLGLVNGSRERLVPTRIMSLRNIPIRRIACGAHHTAVLSCKGEVYTFGRNHRGQLGYPIAQVPSDEVRVGAKFRPEPIPQVVDDLDNACHVMSHHPHDYFVDFYIEVDSNNRLPLHRAVLEARLPELALWLESTDRACNQLSVERLVEFAGWRRGQSVEETGEQVENLAPLFDVESLNQFFQFVYNRKFVNYFAHRPVQPPPRPAPAQPKPVSYMNWREQIHHSAQRPSLGSQVNSTSAAVTEYPVALTQDEIRLRHQYQNLSVLADLFGESTLKEAIQFNRDVSGARSAGFGRLLSPGHRWSSDIKLKSSTKSETVFYAHKCILSARSEYFKAMFSVGLAERSFETLTLDAADDTIRHLLEFIYTGTCTVPNNDKAAELILDLLQCGSYYQLPALKLWCESSLSGSIDLTNVIPLYEYATLYEANFLAEYCLFYLATNYELMELESDLAVSQEILNATNAYRVKNKIDLELPSLSGQYVPRRVRDQLLGVPLREIAAGQTYTCGIDEGGRPWVMGVGSHPEGKENPWKDAATFPHPVELKPVHLEPLNDPTRYIPTKRFMNPDKYSTVWCSSQKTDELVAAVRHREQMADELYRNNMRLSAESDLKNVDLNSNSIWRTPKPLSLLPVVKTVKAPKSVSTKKNSNLPKVNKPKSERLNELVANVMSQKKVVRISAGSSHLAFLTEDNFVYCMGAGFFCQCGNMPCSFHASPYHVAAFPPTVTNITCGLYTTAAWTNPRSSSAEKGLETAITTVTHLDIRLDDGSLFQVDSGHLSARSPYFAQLVQAATTESHPSSTSESQIEDTVPSESKLVKLFGITRDVFKVILTYRASETDLPVDPFLLLDIFVAASRFRMNSLVEAAEQALSTVPIDRDNVFELLKRSDTYSCFGFRLRCLRFIRCRLDECGAALSSADESSLPISPSLRDAILNPRSYET
eukprot:GILK01010601.1.p1 GENE.GILK01010601.1~~GILK01010601.1.p1  ORF type:complete len:1261 (-),score=219.19 GILK01010601.1:91-3840(-)